MAAPSGTVWSTPSTGTAYQGRIGLYVTTSSSETQTTVKVQIWYWSQYSCSDASNTFYFNWQSQSATSSIGSKNINTTSNQSWSTANQIKIAEYSKTYNRGKSSQTYYCATKFTGIEYGGGNSYTVYTSYTIPAKKSYLVSYSANGGTGAPTNQTKWYNEALLLSGTIPTRKGYVFQGWATSPTSKNVEYTPGATYYANAELKLYAVWKNASDIDIKVNGTYKAGKAYVKINGVYKEGTTYVRVNGVYKKGTGD